MIMKNVNDTAARNHSHFLFYKKVIELIKAIYLGIPLTIKHLTVQTYFTVALLFPPLIAHLYIIIDQHAS